MENLNIPNNRAKKTDSSEYIEGCLFQSIEDYVLHVKSDGLTNDEYKKALREEPWCIMDNLGNTEMIDTSTLAIQMGKRNLFMSLDVETGKGGDKISDNKVLVWNDEMMNCSILEIMDNGAIEYEISLDNVDFDKMKGVGIQE